MAASEDLGSPRRLMRWRGCFFYSGFRFPSGLLERKYTPEGDQRTSSGGCGARTILRGAELELRSTSGPFGLVVRPARAERPNRSGQAGGSTQPRTSARRIGPRRWRRRHGSESFALHATPGAAAAQEVPEGFHLEEREDLAVTEILQDGEEDQGGEVLPVGVAAEGDLLEQDGGDRKEDAEEDCEDHEQ